MAVSARRVRLFVAGLAILSGAAAVHQPPPASDPEAVAVRYLAREVPRWRREHPCYSCHNNGDAARALIAASARRHDVAAPLADTLDWVSHPDRWDANKAEGGFDDRPLARIQFAGALTSAVEASLVPPAPLASAAPLVAADQKADGSWRLDSSQSLGSPATYGTALATWSARRTLVAAADPRLADAIARADAWIRGTTVATVLDASAITLALDRASDGGARRQRIHCLEILRDGQGPGGGWGPYVTSAAEPFDTALALVALEQVSRSPALAAPVFAGDALRTAIARGRRYLLDAQFDDGSWIETTRPAHQESYAQRISTTAWAAIALMQTAGVR
jgi:hypothetical protein